MKYDDLKLHRLDEYNRKPKHEQNLKYITESDFDLFDDLDNDDGYIGFERMRKR